MCEDIKLLTLLCLNLINTCGKNLFNKFLCVTQMELEINIVSIKYHVCIKEQQLDEFLGLIGIRL